MKKGWGLGGGLTKNFGHILKLVQNKAFYGHAVELRPIFKYSTKTYIFRIFSNENINIS